MELTGWEQRLLHRMADDICGIENLGLSIDKVEGVLDARKRLEGDIEDLEETREIEWPEDLLKKFWSAINDNRITVSWPVKEKSLDLKEKLENIIESQN